MNPESKLWKLIREHLPARCHSQRIENTTERGTPDLHIFIDGKDYWVELKMEQANDTFVRKEQFVWAARRAILGGKSYIISRSTKYSTLTLMESPFQGEADHGEMKITNSSRHWTFLDDGMKDLLDTLFKQ